MNQIIKGYTHPGVYLIQLYANHYGSRFSTIMRLVSEAKTDFPDLKDDQIEIHFYGGRVKRGYMFIEFAVPHTPPKEYPKFSPEPIIA